MTRRQFAFWIGFGLFSLSEKFHLSGLDALAAAAMRSTEPESPAATDAAAATVTATPEHWAAVSDENWRWYEQEEFVDGKWQLAGTTVPINKETGKPKSDGGPYLGQNLVPAELLTDDAHDAEDTEHAAPAGLPFRDHEASAEVKARHGRPPSKWLRSLNADEIRIWLGTIEVPKTGVRGMTVWTHLTRDHSFDPLKIEGLTIAEQSKLHSAAHFGY